MEHEETPIDFEPTPDEYGNDEFINGLLIASEQHPDEFDPYWANFRAARR